jgi:hypothetical protein
MLLLFGILAGLLTLCGDFFYFADTVKGATRPHRVTWFLFLLINLTDFANQYSIGATHSLWLVIGAIIGTLAVCIASIKRGVGGTGWVDAVCLVGAIGGLLLWRIIGTPVASVVINLVAVTIATIPTMIKAYTSPGSEAKGAWLLCSLGGLCAMVAVGKFDPYLLLLPVHSFVVQLGIFVVLEWRGRMIAAEL